MLPSFSCEPRASTALPSQSSPSSRALGRRQEITRPASASTVSVIPNVGTPSDRGKRNPPASAPSPQERSRGDGENKVGSPAPSRRYQAGSIEPAAAVPPELACHAIAASCGLATTSAASAAMPQSRSRSSDGRAASHGISASRTRIAAKIADSWLTSTARPSISPTHRAWRVPGRRRNRTAASRASGRNTVPAAMFR